MELTALLERMKMEHLLAQLDGVCEQAAKGHLDFKGFLVRALETASTLFHLHPIHVSHENDTSIFSFAAPAGPLGAHRGERCDPEECQDSEFDVLLS